MGAWRGAAAWGCAGLRRGAPWGCAGAPRGAAQGRSSGGRRRGEAVWGCAGAQRGAAQGRSSVSLTGQRSGRGWPKSAGDPGALEVSGGPRSAVGPAPRSAGTNPAEHHPRGRILVEAGGSATPSPRGRTGPGRAPPDGYRGGGRGWAPGLRGPGPWWLWAGAGETGRAPWLRLVRGGRGRAGRARGRTPRGPRGLGEGSRGRPFLEGGGGCSLPGGRRGPLLDEGGGRACIARCRAMWIHGRAAWDHIPNPLRRSAVWGRALARRGAAQGRGVGLRRGAAALVCAGAQFGAERGRGAGLRRGAAARSCSEAQRGAAQGRSSVGPRRGATRGREGAQQRGSAQGRSVGLSSGAAWG